MATALGASLTQTLFLLDEPSIGLHFAYENLAQQKTNMRAALGRMIDVDIAEESTNLATYNVLSQAAASMIAQANATSDLALILLR